MPFSKASRSTSFNCKYRVSKRDFPSSGSPASCNRKEQSAAKGAHSVRKRATGFFPQAGAFFQGSVRLVIRGSACNPISFCSLRPALTMPESISTFHMLGGPDPCGLSPITGKTANPEAAKAAGKAPMPGTKIPAWALVCSFLGAAHLALTCLRRLTISAVRPQRLTTISAAHHPGWLPSPVRGGSG